mgnify:FL=1
MDQATTDSITRSAESTESIISKKLNFNPLIFRDYDIRGIPGKDFDNSFANELAFAIHQFFPAGKIVLSRDLRQSGIPLLKNMQDTLTKLGRLVINAGHNPTPILYYAICKENAVAGIQITASHKGKEWNGFKVNAAGAAPVDAETGIYKIRDLIASNESPKPSNQGTTEHKNYTNSYIKEITEKITINPKHNKPLKVIIDTGNGSVGIILEKILLRLGVHAITINKELDDSFPNHQADPLKDENLIQLQAAVIDQSADLGIALDGDGDRCGIVDEKGQIVQLDKTLMLLTKDALDKGSGNIVTEVRASMAYLDYIKENQGTPIITKAGHSFVLRKVIETNAVFGGELTGHMYFPKEFYNFDDGIFTAVKLTQILSNLTKTLSEQLKTLPEYLASKEYHIKADDSTKFQKIQTIQELAKQENKDFLGIDGVRITYPDIGWLLIRASNTGPTIKCRFEAKTEENFNFLKQELQRFLLSVDLQIN